MTTTRAEVNFKTMFMANVKQAYQADSVVMRGKACRTDGNINGKTVSYPVLLQGESTERVAGTDVIPMNAGEGNAETTIVDYNAPDYVSKEVMKKVAYNQISAYSTRVRKAIGRRSDDVLFRAMDRGKTTEFDIALGSGDQVGLTEEKLLEAQRMLNEASVDPDGRFIAITPGALQSLLQEQKATSSDYISQKFAPLDEGKIVRHLGLNFILSTSMTIGKLPILAGGSTTVRRRGLYVWHKDAVGVATQIDELETNYVPEKTAYLVNALFSAGGTVIDKRGLVRIQIQESKVAIPKSVA